MIPAIQQALMMGYTATQVLKYVSGKVKNLEKGIDGARSSGYRDEDILKFLSGKLSPKNKSGMKKQVGEMDKYLSDIGMKTQDERAEQKSRGIKTAIGVAGTAITAYAAYKGYKGMGAAIEPDEILPAEPQVQKPLGIEHKPSLIEQDVSPTQK